MSGANGEWANALADYLAEKQINSNSFWALNMDGGAIINNWDGTVTLDKL